MTGKGLERRMGNPGGGRGDEAEHVSRLVGELLVRLGEMVREAGPEAVRILTEEELQRQQLNWFRAGWAEHARATTGPEHPDRPPTPPKGSDRLSAGSDRLATGSDRPPTGSDRPTSGSGRPPTRSGRPSAGSGRASVRPGSDGGPGQHPDTDSEEFPPSPPAARLLRFPERAPDDQD